MEACFERSERSSCCRIVVVLLPLSAVDPVANRFSGNCRVSLTSPQPRGRPLVLSLAVTSRRPCLRFPSCGQQELRLRAWAREIAAEEALVEQFPSVSVIPMDVDTTGWKGAHDELVERFRRREADVLLKTQMVAKGRFSRSYSGWHVISACRYAALHRTFALPSEVFN